MRREVKEIEEFLEFSSIESSLRIIVRHDSRSDGFDGANSSRFKLEREHIFTNAAVPTTSESLAIQAIFPNQQTDSAQC
jgi:hypothetical protein